MRSSGLPDHGSGRPSREDILDAFRTCATKAGRTPGRAVFEQLSGISRTHVTYYWPRHSDLAAEAGLESNTLNPAAGDADVFRDYAAICIRLGKVPTSAELRIATQGTGTRSHNTFRRFGSMAELDRRFRA